MPELVVLWDGVVQPILAVLRERTTADQIKQLRDEARENGDVRVGCVLAALYEVRYEMERP